MREDNKSTSIRVMGRKKRLPVSIIEEKTLIEKKISRPEQLLPAISELKSRQAQSVTLREFLIRRKIESLMHR